MKSFLNLTLFIVILTKSTLVTNAQISTAAIFEGYPVTTEGAWCWFADPRALHVENSKSGYSRTFVGAIDSHGTLKAMQYDLKTGQKEDVLIRTCFQPDDHDNPTFLELPDGRIMIFYSRHTDEACFYYRISVHPGDITALGPEKKLKTENNTTYPSPFYLKADPNHIYLCWRGINWHPTIACLSLPDQQDNVSFVKGPFQMVQSTGARPYAKYCSNGVDKIWLAYTTGHPDNEFPNYLYCNSIEIPSMRLTDVKGQELSFLGKAIHAVNKNSYSTEHPLAVADAPADQRDWLWQILLDQKGYPVVAMVKISEDKQNHEYWYLRWNGTEWKSSFLANGGGAFHQSPGLEQCYSGGMAIDESDPGIVYCSVPVKGAYGTIYEIIRYQVDADGHVLNSCAITTHSKMNNVRPYLVRQSAGTPLRLAWMHGNYYDWIVSKQRPEGYPTSIHTDWNAQETVAAKSTKSSSLNLACTVKLKPGAGGDLLKIGSAIWGLDTADLKPYLKIGKTLWKSNNALANSDGWQKQPRGTNGAWYQPEPLQSFLLGISYNTKTLTIRRNGFIDQVLTIKGSKKMKIKALNDQVEFFWSSNTLFSEK